MVASLFHRLADLPPTTASHRARNYTRNMPFTRTIIEVAEADPQRLALAGDGDRFSYGALRDACTLIRSGVEELLGGPDALSRGRSSAETGGVPVVVVSLSRAIDVARFVCGVSGFRAGSSVTASVSGGV